MFRLFGKKSRSILLFLITVFCLLFIHISGYILQAASVESISSQIKQEEFDVEQLAEMVRRIENKWERDYERYFGKNFVNYGRTAKQIAKQLTKISQQTGIKPAVIWAIPQPKQIQLLLITPANQIVRQDIRGADRQTLKRIIGQFKFNLYNTVSNNYTSYLPAAKQLHEWIIAPVEPYLQAENIDTLLLCTGPDLRSLPFAALHDGEHFLIEKYNLTRIPAFNLTDTSYQNKDNKQVLAMGASEFDNSPPLPGVEVELSTIIPKLWSGRKVLNQDFTVENLKAQHQQGQFEIIHLATHAQFNPGPPSNSYIQFADTQINLEQVDQLSLNNPLVDLLVLSACETAIGNEEAEFGFAGLALQAGVKSALASLWLIDDAGTVALMSRFYQHLKSTPIKAEALRLAQIDMLRGEISVQQGQLRGSELEIALPPELAELEKAHLSHPFYWAGFTMIGNPW